MNKVVYGVELVSIMKDLSQSDSKVVGFCNTKEEAVDAAKVLTAKQYRDGHISPDRYDYFVPKQIMTVED